MRRSTFDEFCDLTLPKAEWTHEAHLVVCHAALGSRTPLETVDFLRKAIRAYNNVTGVENTTTSGYHETLTRYYVGAVASLGSVPRAEVVAAARCATTAPLDYWTPTVLFAPTARAGWVHPDRAPLPWPRLDRS